MNEGNKPFSCPISCITLKLLVTLTSFLRSQSFLQGSDFLLCCRQASKLTPRHLFWLSALSSLGETNRCALLLFCSELITGFQAGEISKVSLASAFSSWGGVTCRQAPQPWLSDLIWAQIPVSSLPKLPPSFATCASPSWSSQVCVPFLSRGKQTCCASTGQCLRGVAPENLQLV